MFLTVNRLIALSFATQREQFEQRTKPTWPRPFLLRPLFLLFLVCQKNMFSILAHIVRSRRRKHIQPQHHPSILSNHPQSALNPPDALYDG